VLGIVAVAVAGMVMIGLGRAGSAAVASARADRSADAAALAAAHALARMEGSEAAREAAREAAEENGADLVRCMCAGDAAEVEVTAGRATGRARAEVRTGCILDPEACADP
jgi:hypothetical protein